MFVEDVLTIRTTDPKEDDTFEKEWVCENCGHLEPITDSETEDEI